MQQLIWGLVALLTLAGCGTAPEKEEATTQRLQLVELPTLELTERQEALVVLTALGAQGDVTFSAEGLPSFARLEGQILRIAPQPGDAGEYTLTLSATDGQRTDSREVQVRVARNNTAPSFGTPIFRDYDGTVVGSGSSHTTASNTPYAESGSVDKENDDVRLCAEVAPYGTPFTDVPTHVTPWRESRNTYGVFYGIDGRLNITGLQVGGRYRLAVWLEDKGGLRSVRSVLVEDFTYLGTTPTP
jgi:hypothetical protein